MTERLYRQFKGYAVVTFTNSILDTTKLNELLDIVILNRGSVHISETRDGQHIKLDMVVDKNPYEIKRVSVYIDLKNERGETGPEVALRYKPRARKFKPYRDAVDQLNSMIEDPIMEDVEHLELVSA